MRGGRGVGISSPWCEACDAWWRREGMRRTGARDRAREVSPGSRVREGVGRLEVDGPVDGIRGRPHGEGKGLAGLLSPY